MLRDLDWKLLTWAYKVDAKASLFHKGYEQLLQTHGIKSIEACVAERRIRVAMHLSSFGASL
eukprot:3916765-Prorocentrum_lima.AAC.1